MNRLGCYLAVALLAVFEPGAPVLANVFGGVKVDQASVRAGEDERDMLVISGRMVNSLSVRTRDIRVKLSIFNSDGSEIRSWESRPRTIAAHTYKIFVFRIHPNEYKGATHYLPVVSEYELDNVDMPAALSLADETNPPLLLAVIKTLGQEVYLHPTQITDAFKAAGNFGRLCLSEAILASGGASSVQFLAEQLLAGRYTVDQQRLKHANQIARQASELEPFPLLAQWQTSNELKADVRNLLWLSRRGGLAAIVRMSIAGTLPESKLFASETLHTGNLESIERQFLVSDKASRLELHYLYRELAQWFPSDPHYRRAIGMADWYLNGFFIFLVLVAAIAIPVFAFILGIREKS